MVILLGCFLSIIIPFIIYKMILKGNEFAGKKLYIKTFILGATLYTIPIIILEILWDIFFKGNGDLTIGSSLSQAFLRAALIEEAVKFFFSYRVLKKNKDLGVKESILLVGLVGVGYGFTEKLFYGSGLAMIINGLFPGHMLFQWIMGYFLYRAIRAENGKKRNYFFMAYIIPFLIHGIWDAGLDVGSLLPEMGEIKLLLDAGITFVMMIMMLVAICVATKKIQKINLSQD